MEVATLRSDKISKPKMVKTKQKKRETEKVNI